MDQDNEHTNLSDENVRLKKEIEELKKELQDLKIEHNRCDSPSEKDFFTYHNTTKDFVYRLKLPECEYQYIGPQLESLTGYSSDEFFKHPQTFRRIIHPDSAKDFIRSWRNMLKGFIPESYEFLIVTKDGRERWLHQKNIIIRDEDEKPVAIEGVVSDITERKIIENSLIRSEAQINAILNNLPHMAWLKNTDGNYLAVNESFAKSISLNTDDVIGKTDYDIFEPQLAQKYRDEDLQILIKREQIFFEEKIEDRYFETFKAPIFDNAGNVIGITGISLEISKRKYAEEEIKEYSDKLALHNAKLKIINDELKKAKEKAEESDKLKSAFLANMSHEIRTPMNAILGFATLLKNRKLPDEKRNNFIDLINSNCKQLLRIITDIIDISKIESGQITLYNKNFNINTTIKSLFDNYSGQIATLNKAIKLKMLNGLSDNESMIYADKLRIEQIISNFLSNAIKFTHDGSIEFGYVLSEGKIKFFVTDTGIGLSKDELRIIFERFRQGTSAYNRTYGGTGLGLSISKGLADIMGGEINVISEKNIGSTFSYSMEYKPGFNIDEKLPHSSKQSEYKWKGKVFLIAEDEEANYSLLENIIRPTKAKIIRAYNGLEAVNICNSNKKIDLILMDIKMPEMNGLEATRRIRKVRKDLPIIAQTAYAMASDEESCFDAGCDDYFAKPLSIDALLEKINAQLMKANIKEKELS